MTSIDKRVTIIIPTYNRQDILLKTLGSYIDQKYVEEILIIDDGGNFHLNLNLSSNKSIRILKNEERCGAYNCKLMGVNAAKTELVLFGEDDVFLSPNYVEELVQFYSSNEGLGVVSGSIVYMPKDADYKNIDPSDILVGEKLFDYKTLKFNPFYWVNSPSAIPFTHALFITKKLYFENVKRDNFYNRGNGYREESDFQMTLQNRGKKNLIIPNCFCYHLNMKNVSSGGQRVNRFKKLYWTVKLNNYFLNKHYITYATSTELNQSLIKAKINFFLKEFFSLFINPIYRRFQ